MKHIDILLDFFATEHDKWARTYFSLLPLELLQKIFDLNRQHELLKRKRIMHLHFLCRRRCFGERFYDHQVVHYPYFSSNEIKIEQGVNIDRDGSLSVSVRFSKEYSEMFTDKQYVFQRPHFTIYSKVKELTEYHYQVLDWKYYGNRKLGKCL